MSADIITIAMELLIPSGRGGEPVKMDVRAYLVPYEAGLVLVDTGMDPSGDALDTALAQHGASWSDVTDVVVTHGHPDHVGALPQVRRRVPGATIHAGTLEPFSDANPLADGDTVGPLRAFATPGHTPGHVSLIDEGRGVVLVGDCLGSIDGRLVRAPQRFTADADEAEASLHRLLALRGNRMLLGHGSEVSRPWESLDTLLGESGNGVSSQG